MTSISEPIDRFLHKIEEDRRFFNVFEKSEQETMDLALSRARAILEEAVDRVMMECRPSVDFTQRDEVTGDFVFDFNPQEKTLIPSIMYEIYLERDFSYIKLLNVNYTNAELKVFDPSNARSTFLALYDRVKLQNDYLLDVYKNTDRSTGGFIELDYSLYDTED